jgi:VWFA-related protein
MIPRFHPFKLAAALLVLAFSIPVFAQAGAEFMIDRIDLDNFPQLTAKVTVANFGGAPIAGKSAEDFSVKEDGQELPLDSLVQLSDSVQPLSIVLVLDLSGSAPIEDVKTAALQFLDYLGPNDRVALLAFNTPPDPDMIDPFKETDFTGNKDLVRKTIENLPPPVAESAVYEAIQKAILNAAKETAARRAVLVMSDGYDTASRENIAAAGNPREAAKSKNIPVFTVGVYSSDQTLGKNPDYLKVLAKESGGNYQEASSPAELGLLFQNVVDLLRVQYVLTFQALQPADGQMHRLDITVKLPDGPQTATQDLQYPAPPPEPPQISSVKMEKNSALQPESAELSGKVLLVPEISQTEGSPPLTSVEYKINGQSAHKTDMQNPPAAYRYRPEEWEWDAGALPPGTYRLDIIATDASGAATTLTLEGITIITPPEPPVTVTPTPPSTPETNWLLIIGVLVLLLAVALAVVLFIIFRKKKAPQPAAYHNTGSLFGPNDSIVGGVGGAGLNKDWDATGEDGLPYDGSQTEIYDEDKTAILSADELDDEKTVIISSQYLFGTLVDEVSEQEYPINKAAVKIGRAQDNDIILKDNSVSRQHATIKHQEGGALKLTERKVSNPIMVNEKPIPAAGHILKNDDRIKFGRITLVFKKTTND